MRAREPDLVEAIRRRFEPFGGVDDSEPHPPVTVGNRLRSSTDHPRHQRYFRTDWRFGLKPSKILEPLEFSNLH